MFNFIKVTAKSLTCFILLWGKWDTVTLVKEKCQQWLLSNLQSASYQQKHSTHINQTTARHSSPITFSSRALSFLSPILRDLITFLSNDPTIDLDAQILREQG